MDSEIVKSKPLTKEETKFLLDLIESNKIITTKTTNATCNKFKNEEWVRIAQRFNAQTSSFRRTPQQLRLKWENMKKNARKRCAKLRMSQIKTGGGPSDYIPPDDILDRVAGLLGSTASGFTVPYGGDGETGGGVYKDHVDGEESCDGLGAARVYEDIDPALTILKPQAAEVHFEDSAPQIKKNTLCTPKTVKRKKTVESNSQERRNNAIAEYYIVKKQCLEEKITIIHLENEQLKIKNEILKLELENLKKSSR